MSLAAEERIGPNFAYQWASGAVIPVASVALAIVVGGVVVAITGSNPFNAYWQLLQGAFGTPYDVSETLVSAIPLMLAGLAVAFAFRVGLFNIGAEGQLYIGALASAYIGYKWNAPAIILIPAALAVGALGGAIWAGIAGVLKAWRGAHEVISTIMLNYIAIYISHYMLQYTPTGQPGPMDQTTSIGNPETAPMNAHLPVIVPNAIVQNARLSAGLVVALAAAVLFWFLLSRTTLGYQIRAVGLNQKAAAYGCINVGWTIVVAMLIAGGFAGLAGMVTVFGIAPYQLTDSFSPGYGFDAIAVALLGKNTAPGVILAAILFGALEHGSGAMQANANVSQHLVEILQGLIIFFIAADRLVAALTRRGIVRLPLWERKELAA